MEEQHDGAVGRTVLDVGHPERDALGLDVYVPGRPGEAGQVLEAIVGGAQDVHGVLSRA